MLRRIWAILVYVFAGIGLILVLGYTGVEMGWTNTRGIVDTQHDYFKKIAKNGTDGAGAQNQPWMRGEEWSSLKEAIRRDTDVINRVSRETGVPARVIVAPLVVEQLRLFYSEREIFKAIFGPLKILGNQSQFSWGVMGIKQDTARLIETHLASSTSPFYTGPQLSHILDYPATTTVKQADADDAVRFARLTDDHNRYYSYLYGAIYMKEIMAQWSRYEQKGADLSVGVLATLYNIGFANSKPHGGPQIGGAEITVNGSVYSFGGLAQAFYDSDELIDVFPR
jgi:hypothetical protein